MQGAEYHMAEVIKMGKLDAIEEQIVTLMRARDTEMRALEAEQKRQEEYEREREEAKKALPAARKEEDAFWAEYDAHIDALSDLMDRWPKLSGKIRAAYGKPGRVVHNSTKLAVKSELQRRALVERVRARMEADPDELAKQQAKRLRDTAKEIDQARRKMYGGGGSTDQARSRAEEMRETADKLEGKGQQRDRVEEDAMFIPMDVALRG